MSTEPAAASPAPAREPVGAQEPTGTATLATILRGAMHLAFAVLLSLGVLRAVTVDEVDLPLGVVIAALVAAIYGTGTALAHRRRDPSAVAAADLLMPSPGWVIALLIAWVGATWVSSAFVWIAFPLFFLVLFTIGPISGPLALLVVAAWAVLAPLAVGDQGSLAVGEILGPLVGAVFSLVAHTVWRRLLEESERNRRLVAQLRAAQADLADSERRKGVAEERQRLAQDIHDTLAQGLNSIVLFSRSARASQPDAETEFARIEDIARANLADARLLVRDLAERAPEEGAEQVLRTVVECARQVAGATSIELRSDGTPSALPDATVETLQRAAQSLLANVLQHAAAERCVLTLAWWPYRVSLDVVDDGRGFDPSVPGAGPDGGDGLRLLRTRLARAGGSVAIDSAPGEGNTVGITLPIDTLPTDPLPTDTQEIDA